MTIETKDAHKRVSEATKGVYRGIEFFEDDLHELKRSVTRLLEEVSKCDSFEHLRDQWEFCHQDLQGLVEAERSTYGWLCDVNTELNEISDRLHETVVHEEEQGKNSWRVEMMQELYGLNYGEA